MRNEKLKKIKSETFDVLVIGAGINGAVSAAALSGNGYKTAIIDKRDFGSYTSQESSNLVWGGIKYLENMEFLLVRNLCLSRNHLIKSYPSLIKEKRFLVTHNKSFKHGLLKLFLGTYFYWFIGSFFTQKPKFFTLKDIETEEPKVATNGCDGGFEYSDAWISEHDARLVFTFINEGISHGSVPLNYIEAISCNKDARGLWVTQVKDKQTGEKFEIKSKAIVNACGPFLDSVNKVNGITTNYKHVFSKGIHLIVDKIPGHDRVITFFTHDNRMFFVIPLGDKSCIGTTDSFIEELPAKITDEDRRYVLDNINAHLKQDYQLTLKSIISERCGVRPLVFGANKALSKNENFLNLTRKHIIEVDKEKKYLSVFGGKLTDCLNIGDEIVGFLKTICVASGAPVQQWYGEPSLVEKQKFLDKLMNEDFKIDNKVLVAERLWRRYFVKANEVLEIIRKDKNLGTPVIVNGNYLWAEVYYAKEKEMVCELEDLLRRRSDLALTTKHNDLKNSDSINKLAEVLFGELAEIKQKEYFKNQA